MIKLEILPLLKMVLMGLKSVKGLIMPCWKAHESSNPRNLPIIRNSGIFR